MVTITPWPIKIIVLRSPEKLENGALVEFTMLLGPIPVQWLTEIEIIANVGFVDRLVKGPFDQWEHTHAFTEIDKGTTNVQDVIKAKLHKNPFLWLVGLGMWLGLPGLFAYRAWKTRKLLSPRQPVK